MLFIRFILSMFVLAVSGCGTTKDYIYDKTVILNEEQPIKSEEINVTKAIDTLKEQIDGIESIYVSKDHKNLFVYQRLDTLEKTYALYDYDITGKIPNFRNEIQSGYRAYVYDLLPLDNGYLVYESGPFHPKIILYDYIKKRTVRRYFLDCDLGKLKLTDDNKSLIIQGYKLDINDIYEKQDNLSDDRTIEWGENVLIDHKSKLIWQLYDYDFNVTDNLYTFHEAVEICKQMPGYAWRLPTIKDIIRFSKGRRMELTYSTIFDAQKINVSSSIDWIQYWVIPDDFHNLNHLFKYSRVNGYDFYKGYDDFWAAKADEKQLVRCVADLEE